MLAVIYAWSYTLGNELPPRRSSSCSDSCSAYVIEVDPRFAALCPRSTLACRSLVYLWWQWEHLQHTSSSYQYLSLIINSSTGDNTLSGLPKRILGATGLPEPCPKFSGGKLLPTYRFIPASPIQPGLRVHAPTSYYNARQHLSRRYRRSEVPRC